MLVVEWAWYAFTSGRGDYFFSGELPFQDSEVCRQHIRYVPAAKKPYPLKALIDPW